MNSNKRKCFSLVEILVAALVITIALAITAPILTKRMKNSQNSGCIRGTRPIKKIFLNDSEFVVPENIYGDITVTMIGGGGGGGRPVVVPEKFRDGDGFAQVYGTGAAGEKDLVDQISERHSNDRLSFYKDINLKAVADGQNVYDLVRGGPVLCRSQDYEGASTAPSGESGISYYLKNLGIRKGGHLGLRYNGKCNPDSDVNVAGWRLCGDTVDTSMLFRVNNNPGIRGSVGNPSFIQGGAPAAAIPRSTGDGRIVAPDVAWSGVGVSCFYEGQADRPVYSTFNIYDIQNSTYHQATSSNAAFIVTYNRATPAGGGGAGSYAKFQMEVNPNQNCLINIGRGGKRFGGVSENNENSNGGSTSIQCGDENSRISVNGGLGAIEAAPGGRQANEGNNIPESASKQIGEAGGSASNELNLISGGAGGSVRDGRGNVLSEGGFGGCQGASKTDLCSDPYGKNGVSPSSDLRRAGSGGGGGSCDRYMCAPGGDGADGIVILEYKVRCY